MEKSKLQKIASQLAAEVKEKYANSIIFEQGCFNDLFPKDQVELLIDVLCEDADLNPLKRKWNKFISNQALDSCCEDREQKFEQKIYKAIDMLEAELYKICL